MQISISKPLSIAIIAVVALLGAAVVTPSSMTAMRGRRLTGDEFTLGSYMQGIFDGINDENCQSICTKVANIFLSKSLCASTVCKGAGSECKSDCFAFQDNLKSYLGGEHVGGEPGNTGAMCTHAVCPTVLKWIDGVAVDSDFQVLLEGIGVAQWECSSRLLKEEL